MGGWGKVLGFLFGFMLTRHIVGALIGLWLGHRFDKGMGTDFNAFNRSNEETRQAAFFYCTFSTMGYMAKANGRVSEKEIAFATAYMDRLGLQAELRQQAKEAFREGKAAGFPLEERLKKFRKACAGRHDLILLFLEIQIQVAYADGDIEPSERKALHTIAAVFGLSKRELDKLLEMISAGANFNQGSSKSHVSSATQLENAYKVLGVKTSDSDQQIKKAHRKLMAQHHPDKLVAKGLPPEMMTIAKQKAQDIQAAYDLIKKQRS